MHMYIKNIRIESMSQISDLMGTWIKLNRKIQDHKKEGNKPPKNVLRTTAVVLLSINKNATSLNRLLNWGTRINNNCLPTNIYFWNLIAS